MSSAPHSFQSAVDVVLGFLPNIALHLWAIIDVAVKLQQFYQYYPNA